MKYTKYFSGIVRNQGVPTLNTVEFAIFMNIVHLEGAISALNKLKAKSENTSDFYKYDIEILSLEQQIIDLTKNMEPNELIEELVKNSY